MVLRPQHPLSKLLKLLFLANWLHLIYALNLDNTWMFLILLFLAWCWLFLLVSILQSWWWFCHFLFIAFIIFLPNDCAAWVCLFSSWLRPFVDSLGLIKVTSHLWLFEFEFYRISTFSSKTQFQCLIESIGNLAN